MKRHFFLRRWALVLGVCLLLAGILTGSLGWATASSSLTASAASGSSGDAAPRTRSETSQDSGQAAPAAGARPSGPVAGLSGFRGTSKVSENVSAEPARVVRRAWELARDAGAYRFVTELVQTIYPAFSLSNAGRGPQHDALYLEGQLDIPARTMHLSMREGGGATNSRNGGEARIEDGRAYVRQFGGEWQEVEDFSTSFAPDTDLLAYLSGMKHVREVPAEEPGSGGAEEQRNSGVILHAVRFTFHVSRSTSTAPRSQPTCATSWRTSCAKTGSCRST
jgi:hypothetical protein